MAALPRSQLRGACRPWPVAARYSTSITPPWATHQEIQAPRTWDLGNCAINRLLWTPDGLSIVGWADTHHLDDEGALDETSA
jgi:hypothetical protein